MCIVSYCINIHLFEADVYLNMNYTYIAAIISLDNFQRYCSRNGTFMGHQMAPDKEYTQFKETISRNTS